MLEMIMDRHLQFVLLGAVASIGLISKIITGVTLKKLVWAAANMGKSTHPLMRLIRAKYEHACMVVIACRMWKCLWRNTYMNTGLQDCHFTAGED